MATEDILIWDGTADNGAGQWVSLSGNSGLSPEVDGTVDVTPIADCAAEGGTPTAVATPTYYDLNDNVTTDPTKAARTKIKFGFGLVPGCDGTSTEVKATGPHTASKLDKDATPTVTITDADASEGVLDMTFALGIPAGQDGADGTSITIIGTIPGDGPPGASDFPMKGNGDVVVDGNGNGWLWDEDNSSWTDIGPFRGSDGKQALLNQPTTTTVECVNGTRGDATASIVLNAGDSTDEANVYDVTFGIPAGCDGDDGLDAQVVTQNSTPSQDALGNPIRTGCIWIKTAL